MLCLSFPLPETLHLLSFFFKRLPSCLQMERAQESFSYASISLVHFSPPRAPPLHCGPVMATSSTQKKHMQIILKNCNPRIVLHSNSGPGWFFS